MEPTRGEDEERIFQLVEQIKAEKNHYKLMVLTGELNAILSAKASMDS